MNLSIVLLDGEKLNFKINKDSCVIGRSPQCDVVIPHEAMSRKHCLLEVKNGEVFVTDLGSANGVSIEGQRIPPNTATPYQTYFSLAFGAVQSIAIGLEESKDDRPTPRVNKDLSSPSINVKKSDASKVTKSDKTNPNKTVAAAPAKKSNSALIKIVALVAILGVIGYVLTKEEVSEQPTPEQIYE